MSFISKRTILFGDCDPAGIVYTPRIGYFVVEAVGEGVTEFAPGDRVAAYLPNGPQAIIAFLACASIGAVWSLCSPEMGVAAVVDRCRRLRP